MFMQRKMLDEIPTRQNRQSLGSVGMARRTNKDDKRVGLIG